MRQCLLFFLLFSLNSLSLSYLNLSTSNYPPFVICEAGTKMSSSTNTIFQGLEIEMITKALNRLKIKQTEYEINCINENSFVSHLDTNPSSGYFSHETYKIEHLDKKYVYSAAIFDTGLSVLVAGKEDNISFRFLTIFDAGLWIIIVLAALLIAHLIWMIEKSNKGEIKNDYVQGINNSLWNTIAAFFFANDIKIRTFAGRIIYAVFLFLVLVLKAVFLAEFISDYNRISLNSIYTDIRSFGIADTIGTFEEYVNTVKIYNANSVNIKNYSKTNIDGMINDLNAGKIDGIVMDAYLNLYYELQSKCTLKNIGNIFYFFSYPIIFSPDIDPQFVQKINIEILNIKLSIENENLINKYFYANAINCLFKTKIYEPIDFDYIFGVYMIFIGFLGFSMITLAIKKYYANKHKLLEYKQMLSVKSQQYLNKNNLNKDMNMLLKFDKILSTSEKKFKQRLKDLEAVLQQTTNSFLNFSEILTELEKDFERTEND